MTRNGRGKRARDDRTRRQSPAWSKLILVLLGLMAPGWAGAQSDGGMIRGGGFELTDHTGRVVSDESFRGSYMLIYFGYTHCPDVCPTGLSVMTAAMIALGEQGERVQPLFITFDPNRDTPEVLSKYMTHFHPRFLGLSGSKAQVFSVADAYGVAVAETYTAGTPDDNYAMNHSAFTYLVGPDGRLRSMYREGIGGEAMAAAIRKHLEK